MNFSFIFNKSKNPKKSSSMTTIIEKSRANFSKNGILKTDGEKYSSILKEKPTKSTAFTKPEAMKITAIMKRNKPLII